MLKCRVVLLFSLLFSLLAEASSLSVSHIRPYDKTDHRNAYYIDMLKLALFKTEKSYGSFDLKQIDFEMNQLRALINLESNKGLDVVWTMTSAEREERLLPVRIPLLKGLLGYRIFIIRKGTQDIFSNVKSLNDLKELEAGQGLSWPDTTILKANKLRVVEASGYSILFSMLEAGRFDYFPRGVNEPWSEVRAHKDKNLEVEKTLIIQYPAPIYFFVNKDNHGLAHRLEDGLRMAIEDGSFEKLFRNHPANKEIFEFANIEERLIFRLDNPLLPKLTPLHEKNLWYQVN